jgi:hypothetical protein
MCRNIKPLFNYDSGVSDAEIRASALQYVRKVSGYTRPSQANETVFAAAVEEVASATRRLLAGLVTAAPPRSRERQVARARERAQQRQASPAPARPHTPARSKPHATSAKSGRRKQ